MAQQLKIKTKQGFDGGAPFQFGPPTPDFAAGTDPARFLRSIAAKLSTDESATDKDGLAWNVAFLNALADNITLEDE